MGLKFSHTKLLTYAATLTIDRSDGYADYKVIITGNVAIELTGSRDGDSGTILVVQDGTGTHTVTLTGNDNAVTHNTTADNGVVYAWKNYDGLIIWFSEDVGEVDISEVPDAPTLAVVDDVNDEFDWTNNPLYTDVADYEYTLDGGTTPQDVTVKPLAIGNVSLAAGQVGVRVKAATGITASDWLFSAEAFTASDVTEAIAFDVNTGTNGAAYTVYSEVITGETTWRVSGGQAGYGHLAVRTTKSLAANTEGDIRMNLGNSSFSHTWYIGFNTAGSQTAFASMPVCFRLASTAAVFPFESNVAGSPTSTATGLTWQTTDWLRLHRTAGGVFTIQKSTDDAASWTTIYTFTYTTTAEVFAVLDSGKTGYFRKGQITNFS